MASKYENTSVSENGTNPDLWDKEDYCEVEEVAEWALQMVRETDDEDVLNHAKDLLVATELYIDKAYNREGYELTGESDRDLDYIRGNIEDEISSTLDPNDPRFYPADDLRYKLERLEEVLEKKKEL